MTASTAISRYRPTRLGIAIGLLSLLPGCVAAVAIPLVAGGTLYARQEGVFVRAATPVASSAQGAEDAVQLASVPAPTPAPNPTSPDLIELPAFTLVDPRAKLWQPFIDHALEQGAALAETPRPQSALLATSGVAAGPQRRPCATRSPAVIVDLDPARDAFTPDPGAQPSPGLAAGLARLREAGFVVLWLSELPAGHVREVAEAVRETGLDPQGQDQFLLLRRTGDRKQLLREEAMLDVCVVAIAGDQRSDFDELFDYLRDPREAAGFQELLGKGWFLVPPPLQPPAP